MSELHEKVKGCGVRENWGKGRGKRGGPSATASSERRNPRSRPHQGGLAESVAARCFVIYKQEAPIALRNLVSVYKPKGLLFPHLTGPQSRPDPF